MSAVPPTLIILTGLQRSRAHEWHCKHRHRNAQSAVGSCITPAVAPEQRVEIRIDRLYYNVVQKA